MSRYIVDNYTFRKLEAYIEQQDEPLVAIFDIGTKACRVIIAPKRVAKPTKENWSRDTFFNGSGYFKLGEDVDIKSNYLDPESERLWKVIRFVRFYTNFLLDERKVAQRDFHFFGTAVFRWLKNQDEILRFFYRHTGYELKVLSEEEESYFSLISLQYTVGAAFGREVTAPNIEEYDAVFLIDQGGGSTEISYFATKKPDLYDHTSIEKFGTIALKDLFFRLNSTGKLINPLFNNNNIPTQIMSLDNYIVNALENWNYFDNVKFSNVLFFGMGSAIHNMSNTSNLFSHNRTISLSDIEQKIMAIAINLNGKYREVSNLYTRIRKDLLHDKDAKNLTLFYGLPVYAHIMRKFQVDSIQLAGFGLRYGIYIYLYAHLRANLSKKTLPDIPAFV